MQKKQGGFRGDFLEDLAEGSFVYLLITLPLKVAILLVVALWVFVVTPVYNFLKRKGWLVQTVLAVSVSFPFVKQIICGEEIEFSVICGILAVLLFCAFLAWLIFDVIIGPPESTNKDS